MSASTEIQETIRDLVLDGDKPTEREFSLNDVRLIYYGEDFISDSDRQKNAVYYSVDSNRKKAIQDIISRSRNSLTFYNELREICLNRFDEIDGSKMDENYKESFKDLIAGKLVKDRVKVQFLIEATPVYAVWWKDRVIDNAKNGHCLIIPVTGGKNARWKLECVFYLFSERDLKIAKHFWLSQRSVFQRMVDTRQKIPSGTPVERLIEQMTILMAELEDGTSWKCPNCSASNLAVQFNCVICGTPRA